MIADNYRYAAQSDDTLTASAEKYYYEGLKISLSDLYACNPIRLGLILNLCVFLKDFK